MDVPAMCVVEPLPDLPSTQVEGEEVAACLELSDLCFLKPEARGYVLHAIEHRR